MNSSVQQTPTVGSCVSSVVFAGCVGALGFGVCDALWASTQADSDAWFRAALFAAGLCAPLGLVLSFGAGLLQGVLPVDTTLSGARTAFRRFYNATKTHESAVRIAASLWTGGLGLGLLYAGMAWLNRTFIVTFHNPTLSALLLAAVTIVWVGIVVGLVAWCLPNARRLLGRLGALASPWLPIGLVALGGMVSAVAVPMVFEETWQALALKAPVAAVLTVGLVWFSAGLLEPKLREGRMRIVLFCVATMLAVGLFTSTTTLFGSSEEDNAVGYLLEEHSLLTRYPLAATRTLFDGDGDGYASRFAGGDCDDTNATINPGADEVMGNGLDEDCDGADLALPDPKPVKVAEPTPAKTPSKPAPEADRKHYNILWVMVDTLRPDHTGWGGYTRPTTPNTDKIAARATVFENAYTVASITSMVVGPLLAGRYPSEMERRYAHFIRYDPANLLIGEVLQEKGYLTGGAGAHWYLQREYGMLQGLMRWHPFAPKKGANMDNIASSKEVTDNAVMVLEHLSQGKLPPRGPDDAEMPDTFASKLPSKPWFMYLHYMDPHKNYLKHEGFDFGNSIKDRYDGEIRFMDHHLKRLWDALEKADPGLENTVIVFTSDHGEGLGERGIKFHGVGLYENQIRSTLFVYVPGAKPRRIATRVSLIDVAPTLLDAVNVAIPDSFRGTSLLPQIADGVPLKGRPIYAEMPPGPRTGQARSFTVGNLKLMHNPKSNFFRMFDISTDALERKNLWTAKPEEAARMKEAYQRFRATTLEPEEARGTP